MGLRNVVLLSQIAGYIVVLILSLCVICPMLMHRYAFNGHCLIFSNGKWQESDGQFQVQWASLSFCNFVIVVGFLMFILSGIQIYRISRLLHKGEDCSFLAGFFEVILTTVMCGWTIPAALIVTLGFMNWCQFMTMRFPSCEVAAGQSIDKVDGIDTSGFYVQMGTAQFGIWSCFVCWVGLSVLAMIKTCRYHQLANLRASMYRERQRIVQEAADYDPLEGQAASTTDTQ